MKSETSFFDFITWRVSRFGYPRNGQENTRINNEIRSTVAAPTPSPEPLQSVADQYFIPAIAGLFALVIVVLALVVLLMLRKRP